jgi:branched-chain amino acid transport system permease protein
MAAMELAPMMQVFVSGLLMGLLYALIAVGLSLIFGLMNVVNFAHGEFLMIAMYGAFGLWLAMGLDPVVSAPIVVAMMFGFGALTYMGVVRFAMRAKANAAMVQIFATFGFAIFLQGVAQFFFSPDYRSITNGWLGEKTFGFGTVFVPLPQLVGGVVSVVVFALLYLLMTRTDFGRSLEATREDQGAVALVGINRNQVFALGWGLGAALVGVAGVVLSTFYYIYPNVGGPFALISYVVVALGGFGSVFGALAAGIIVGLVEAFTAVLLPPSMKMISVYALYLAVVILRPRGLFGRL